MHYRHKKPKIRRRSYRSDKVLLRRSDKRRIKAALCRVGPDERRAGYRPNYDRWNWE